MTCERLLDWPADRLWSMMCRIPKADGGYRLLAVVHMFQRVWGRLRRGISRQWVREHRSEYVWGSRSRYTSSDSAFAHNLASDIAVLRDHFAAT
eukprot:6064874-Pyramimonas_sp.AAC.1